MKHRQNTKRHVQVRDVETGIFDLSDTRFARETKKTATIRKAI